MPVRCATPSSSAAAVNDIPEQSSSKNSSRTSYSILRLAMNNTTNEVGVASTT